MTPREARKARSTAKWQRLRSRHLGANPLCVHCGHRAEIVAATDVDHIIPIRSGGDFWDPSNLQSLCRDHHQVKTAREARRRDPICVHGYGPGECRRCT